MAILKVLCIKDVNPKLITMEWLVKEGTPSDVPKEGNVYSSDGFWHHPEYGWYIHLLEFPHKEAGWNAGKFVMETDPNVNIENLLNEMYGNQSLSGQGERSDVQDN